MGNFFILLDANDRYFGGLGGTLGELDHHFGDLLELWIKHMLRETQNMHPGWGALGGRSGNLLVICYHQSAFLKTLLSLGQELDFQASRAPSISIITISMAIEKPDA